MRLNLENFPDRRTKESLSYFILQYAKFILWNFCTRIQCILIKFTPLFPWLTPEPHTVSEPLQLWVLFVDVAFNPSSAVIAAHMFMGVESSTRVLSIYQGPHTHRKLTFPAHQPSAIHRSSARVGLQLCELLLFVGWNFDRLNAAQIFTAAEQISTIWCTTCYLLCCFSLKDCSLF